METTNGQPGPAGQSVHTLLLLAANPSDTTRLALGREFEHIDDWLRRSDLRHVFRVEKSPAARVKTLQDLLLQTKPAIVHFSGHGAESGQLLLEDETGRAHPVSEAALSELFYIFRHDVRCVVLNACDSEPLARVLAQHIGVVIGMAAPIQDDAAMAFSEAFYRALGYGKDFKTAFDLGRNEITLRNLPGADVPRFVPRDRLAETSTLGAPTAAPPALSKIPESGQPGKTSRGILLGVGAALVALLIAGRLAFPPTDTPGPATGVDGGAPASGSSGTAVALPPVGDDGGPPPSSTSARPIESRPPGGPPEPRLRTSAAAGAPPSATVAVAPAQSGLPDASPGPLRGTATFSGGFWSLGVPVQALGKAPFVCLDPSPRPAELAGVQPTCSLAGGAGTAVCSRSDKAHEVSLGNSVSWRLPCP